MVITFTTVLPVLGRSPAAEYPGRAAIPSRERPGAFLVPSRPPLVSSWTYRLALPLGSPNCSADEVGLSPVSVVSHFCPGDPTNHSDGPHLVTKFRGEEGRISPSGLHPIRETGPPSEPNRDTPRSIFTWPLRRRSLPSDAGCIPRQSRVRVKISERAWTRPGRIRFHQLSFLIKSHRLRLSHPHLRLTPNPTRKRGNLRDSSLARRVSVPFPAQDSVTRLTTATHIV